LYPHFTGEKTEALKEENGPQFFNRSVSYTCNYQKIPVTPHKNTGLPTHGQPIFDTQKTASFRAM